MPLPRVEADRWVGLSGSLALGGERWASFVQASGLGDDSGRCTDRFRVCSTLRRGARTVLCGVLGEINVSELVLAVWRASALAVAETLSTSGHDRSRCVACRVCSSMVELLWGPRSDW